MLQHFNYYLLQFLEQKLLECLIILSIFRFRVERCDIFFAVPVLEMLMRPVNHKDSLEERVGRFSNSWYITTHEDIDGEFNDRWQFST